MNQILQTMTKNEKVQN